MIFVTWKYWLVVCNMWVGPWWISSDLDCIKLTLVGGGACASS